MKIHNILIIYAFLILDIIIGTISGTFFPVFLAGLPHQVAWISFSFTLFTFMQMISAPILGTLSDVVGRKPVFMLSAIGTSLAQLFLLPIKPLGLFLNRFSDGTTNGMYSTVRSAITDSVPSNEVQRYIGIAETIGSFGVIIGPATAAFIIFFVENQPILQARAVVTTAFFISIISVTLSFLFRETLPKKNQKKLTRRETISLITKNANAITIFHRVFELIKTQPKVGYLVLVQMLMICGFGYYMYLMAFGSAGPLKMTPAELTYFMLYIGVGLTIINSIFFGWVIKKINTKKVTLASLFAMAVVILSYSQVGDRLYLLYVIVTFDLLAGSYLFGLIGGAMAENIDEKTRGEVFGLAQAGSAFMSFFTAVVFSLLALIHPQLPFVWFSSCILAATYLYWRWMKLPN